MISEPAIDTIKSLIHANGLFPARMYEYTPIRISVK